MAVCSIAVKKCASPVHRDRDRILVASPLDCASRAALAATAEVVYAPECRQDNLVADDDLTDASVIVVRSNVRIDEHVVRRHPGLRLVVRAGSGFENVDLDVLTARGIAFVRLGGETTAHSVAEYVVWSLVSLRRRFWSGARLLLEGTWKKVHPGARSISGARVAIWGYGAVGRATHRLLEQMGCEVRALPPRTKPTTIATEPADALVRWADAHVVALPSNASTLSMFGESTFEAMRYHEPLVVSVARLDVVSPVVAVEALRRQWISGLALDSIEHHDTSTLHDALADRDLNLIVTPHLGAQAEDAQRALGARVVEIVRGTTADGGSDINSTRSVYAK